MDLVLSSVTSPMVGRAPDLAAVAGALGVGDPDTAPGGALLLGGDAGVGKTRLLLELGRLATDHGWTVLTGQCVDFGDGDLAYLPFSEALGALERREPDLVARALAERPALARLQPGRRVLDPHSPDGALGSGQDRAMLFDAVHALLDVAAAERPLLLVCEDLHWADRSTTDLLSFLFTRQFENPVALVGSYRADDLHRRHPLRRQVAEWSRLRGVQRHLLGPLDEAAVRDLVSALAPDGATPDEVDDIVARAEGNAFFVEELASAWGCGCTLPDELADLLLVRLDLLGDDARDVVRAASVMGRSAGHDMLAAVLDLDPSTLERAVREAVDAHVLVATGTTYSFRHALLGEAVLDDLLPGERVRLHAACVTALQSGAARGTAAALARHARLAHDVPTGVRASIRAGQEAWEVGGPDEAAQHFQRALELVAGGGDLPGLPDEAELVQVVAAAAEALVATGAVDRAVRLLGEQLDRVGAGERPAHRAVLLSALALIESHSDAPSLDPVRLSEEAVALPLGDAPATRAKVLGDHARVLFHQGRYEDARGPAVEALALAERLALPQLASEVVTTLSSLGRRGPREGLQSSLREAVNRAEESGALASELRARYLLGRSHQDWGEYQEAASWFRSGMERAETAGMPWVPYGFEARWQLGWLHYVAGEWDTALDLCEVRTGPRVQRALLDTVAISVHQARGRPVGERVAAVREVWTEDGSIAVWLAEPALREVARAGLEALREVHDAVMALLGGMWGPGFEGRVRITAVALGLAADLWHEVPSAQHAEHLDWLTRQAARAEEVAQRSVSAGRWGTEGRAWQARLGAELHRLRWLAGGAGEGSADDLIEVWRGAEKAFDALGHVPELARVRVTLAGLLRATGDVAGARTLEESARGEAERLGARTVLDRLPRAPHRTAAAAASGAPGLTDREREVLRLVAVGHTNGEIGSRLFISPKTVSVHVSNILAKLGASGRTEAATIAARDGLL